MRKKTEVKIELEVCKETYDLINKKSSNSSFPQAFSGALDALEIKIKTLEWILEK